jgi:hypothetical protein
MGRPAAAVAHEFRAGIGGANRMRARGRWHGACSSSMWHLKGDAKWEVIITITGSPRTSPAC